MGQRCGYGKVGMAKPLMALQGWDDAWWLEDRGTSSCGAAVGPCHPLAWKTQGLGRECQRQAKFWGGRQRGTCASGGSHPCGNGHACRDSSLECCPSNPDLISFILRTINPSSLPMVPYHAAEARTESLKLTITQSECLFGVIQSRGKVREGRRKALVSFLQDIASPAVLKWCLNKMNA